MSDLMGKFVREEGACVDVEMTVFGDCEVITRLHGIIDQRFCGDVFGTGKIGWWFGTVKDIKCAQGTGVDTSVEGCLTVDVPCSEPCKFWWSCCREGCVGWENGRWGGWRFRWEGECGGLNGVMWACHQWWHVVVVVVCCTWCNRRWRYVWDGCGWEGGGYGRSC